MLTTTAFCQHNQKPPRATEAWHQVDGAATEQTGHISAEGLFSSTIAYFPLIVAWTLNYMEVNTESVIWILRPGLSSSPVPLLVVLAQWKTTQAAGDTKEWTAVSAVKNRQFSCSLLLPPWNCKKASLPIPIQDCKQQQPKPRKILLNTPVNESEEGRGNPTQIFKTVSSLQVLNWPFNYW